MTAKKTTKPAAPEYKPFEQAEYDEMIAEYTNTLAEAKERVASLMGQIAIEHVAINAAIARSDYGAALENKLTGLAWELGAAAGAVRSAEEFLKGMIEYQERAILNATGRATAEAMRLAAQREIA